MIATVIFSFLTIHLQLFVACISEDYYASESCIEEILYARKRGKEIIPLLLEEMEDWLPKNKGVSLCLVPYVYIKTYGTKSEKEWLNKLLTRVQCLV